MNETPLLKAGQTLLLSNRRWHLRQVSPAGGRKLRLEAIGASEASLGMTRQMTAVHYGHELFIARGRQPDYWYGHLRQDWVDSDTGPVLQCRPATGLDLLAAHTRHLASGDLKNEFSWSYSRAAKYRQCSRAYYYHYYASWEGWRSDAPEPVRQVYLLKNLTDLSRWVGNLVHESIKFALSRLIAGQPLAEADLMKQIRTRARSDFDDSQRGRYRQQPNRFTGFQEHYYQLALPSDVWQTAWASAGQYLHTFLRSALYDHLCRQSPATFLDLEELNSFTLAETKVWVQPDLARREEDTIVLYDWKTGPLDQVELRQQLGVYGLYVRKTWPELIGSDVPVHGIVYDLANDHLFEFELDETTLQETEAMVKASVTQLRGLLLDSEATLAELRRFPMIADLDVCQRCQFRELCGRDK